MTNEQNPVGSVQAGPHGSQREGEGAGHCSWTNGSAAFRQDSQTGPLSVVIDPQDTVKPACVTTLCAAIF